jgi:hypothetical protein
MSNMSGLLDILCRYFSYECVSYCRNVADVDWGLVKLALPGKVTKIHSKIKKPPPAALGW